MYTRKQITLIGLFVVIAITAWHCRDAAAKSVYAITRHDTSIITAYNVNDVNLDFQTTVPNFPNHEEGAVGLALDPESEILFVTYELSNIIEMVNAKTMIWEQNPVTVPQATGLAGIVFDEAKQRLYVVDRRTDSLFVYLWDGERKSLTLGPDNPKTLAYLGGDGAYGLALDTNSQYLFVTNTTNMVSYYDTGDPNFAYEGRIDIVVADSNRQAIGIAIDATERCMYTGVFHGSDGPHRYIVRTDINDVNNPSSSEDYVGGYVIGLTVDEPTGLLYITTKITESNQRIYVYDTNTWPSDPCSFVDANISHPADIIVRGDVSYKPPRLGLQKTHDVNTCVLPGDDITYTITYDANGYEANNVILTDYLSPGVDFNSASDDWSYNVALHTVFWDIGHLDANESNSVTLNVIANNLADPVTGITNPCEIESDIHYTEADVDANVCCWPLDILYVDTNAPGDNAGISWYHAYTQLYSALDRAVCGANEIWVAAGTYLPAVGDNDFDLVDGVYLYGGFAGDETSPNDRDWVTNRTILTGRGTGAAAVTASYLSDAVIDGFTVNNLSSQNGIAIDNGSLTVDNCTIQNNGSGISCGTDASLLARYCEILNNSTCGIESDGASSAVIENSWIHHNAYEGIFVWGMTSPLVLRNCTIADSYDYYGVFADALDSRKATISNCIIWGNDDGSLDPLGYYNVTYCCVEGGYSGTENISSDPCFVPEANDYHLDSNSLCIDTADNNAVTDPNELDIDGEDRIIDGNSDGTATVDRGADEYYWSGADLNLDAFVNFLDFAIFASAWQTTPPDPNYNEHCDLEDNNAIDYNDLRIFCNDWLWQAGWTEPFGAGLARSMGAGAGKAEGLQISVSQPTPQPNVDELIKWLEDLWSRDKQLQEMFTEQEWQEFLKLVQQ
jgi:uncharacterized repeat protein (TIGR01451 family)